MLYKVKRPNIWTVHHEGYKEAIQEMTTQEQRHHFQNRLRILRSIDGFEVPGLSNLPKFIRDPFEYMVRCSDADGDLIFRALIKREGGS